MNKKLKKISQFIAMTRNDDTKQPTDLKSMNPEQVKTCFRNFQTTRNLQKTFSKIVGSSKNTKTGKILGSLVGNIVGL